MVTSKERRGDLVKDRDMVVLKDYEREVVGYIDIVISREREIIGESVFERDRDMMIERKNRLIMGN